MNDTTSRRILHLIVEGFPPAKVEELAAATPDTGDMAEFFQLTESSAPEALEKIFAADTVAVWGAI